MGEIKAPATLQAWRELPAVVSKAEFRNGHYRLAGTLRIMVGGASMGSLSLGDSQNFANYGVRVAFPDGSVFSLRDGAERVITLPVRSLAPGNNFSLDKLVGSMLNRNADLYANGCPGEVGINLNTGFSGVPRLTVGYLCLKQPSEWAMHMFRNRVQKVEGIRT